jgi:hypothetical protein
MFAYLLDKLTAMFARAKQRRRDAYLNSLANLIEVERRMNSVDTIGYSH